MTKFELTLARCKARLTPKATITALGYKPEIDETEWLATEGVHSLNDGGYTTALELEKRLGF